MSDSGEGPDEGTSGDGAHDDAQHGELHDVVCAIIARHAGTEPARVTRQGGGLSSHAFEAATHDDRFIVRLGQSPDKLAGFERERRAVERAAAAGIPTQDIVGLGLEGSWAYTIAHRLPGVPAGDHPHRERVLEDLGRIASLVHTIPTVGFGRGFSWVGDDSGDGAASTWSGFLQDEIQANERLDRLQAHGMLGARQFDMLRHTLSDMTAWDAAPVLNHGDLRLKNVMVDHEGRIVGVIDWEVAISSIGPHWDMSLALHDLGVDGKQAFLQGYGMPEADIRRDARFWRLFNTLNYAPQVDQLVSDGDDRGVDRLRSRLQGALDLYGAGE